MKKSIPEIKAEDQERQFWSENDSTDYLDWELAARVSLAKLEPSTSHKDRAKCNPEDGPEAS